MIECTNRELLIYTIARLLAGVRHVAVGMSSPMPAGEGGAMLLRALRSVPNLQRHIRSSRHLCRTPRE